MFEERLLLEDDVRLELSVGAPPHYRLACLKGARVLVEYRSGGRYAFKSVEQLRYDFERDVEDALRQG